MFFFSFVAEHLGLPPINPWLNVFLDFGHGANYAIPGATTLDLHVMGFPLPRQISLHLDLFYEALNRSMSSSSSSASSSAMDSSSSSSSSSSSATDRAAARNHGFSASDRKRLPSIEAIRDGLYVIEIGGLDYRDYLGEFNFAPSDVVTQVVPLVVEQFRVSLEVDVHISIPHCPHL